MNCLHYSIRGLIYFFFKIKMPVLVDGGKVLTVVAMFGRLRPGLVLGGHIWPSYGGSHLVAAGSCHQLTLVASAQLLWQPCILKNKLNKVKPAVMGAANLGHLYQSLAATGHGRRQLDYFFPLK